MIATGPWYGTPTQIVSVVCMQVGILYAMGTGAAMIWKAKCGLDIRSFNEEKKAVVK